LLLLQYKHHHRWVVMFITTDNGGDSKLAESNNSMDDHHHNGVDFDFDSQAAGTKWNHQPPPALAVATTGDDDDTNDQVGQLDVGSRHQSSWATSNKEDSIHERVRAGGCRCRSWWFSANTTCPP
jgi:hypothetical protein